MDPSDTKPITGEIILSDEKSPSKGSIASPTTTKNSKGPVGEALSEKHGAHFFSAFAQNPSNVVFQFQEPDEEIILLVRKHIITNLPWIVLAILLSIAPVFFTPILANILSFISISAITQTALLFTYYLVLFGYILVNFSLWYFHVGLITTERIIDMDFTNILVKHVAETRIDLIEDVSYTQVGGIRTIFNYGDVIIQTAGTKANIEFDRAPRPAVIADIVGDLIQQERDEDS